MKQTVTQYDFTEAFRQTRPENFSYAGQKALFDYLEEYEADTGEEIELDVITLCCDYSEYADLEEFRKDYGGDYETIEDVEEQTTVIRIEGGEGFIIQDF
jgi:hypothetical protein